LDLVDVSNGVHHVAKSNPSAFRDAGFDEVVPFGNVLISRAADEWIVRDMAGDVVISESFADKKSAMNAASRYMDSL
jgi:hypothetical protein